jgi:transcription elongation factor B subunit 1
MSDERKLKFISAEGEAFEVKESLAMLCGMVRTMLSSNASMFSEGSKREIYFAELNSGTLKKVIEYLDYKSTYNASKGQIPPFDIPPESAMELLLAANYLDC